MEISDYGKRGLVLMAGRRVVAVARPVTGQRGLYMLRAYGACWFPRPDGNTQFPATRRNPELLVVQSLLAAREIFKDMVGP